MKSAIYQSSIWAQVKGEGGGGEGRWGRRSVLGEASLELWIMFLVSNPLPLNLWFPLQLVACFLLDSWLMLFRAKPFASQALWQMQMLPPQPLSTHPTVDRCPWPGVSLRPEKWWTHVILPVAPAFQLLSGCIAPPQGLPCLPGISLTQPGKLFFSFKELKQIFFEVTPLLLWPEGQTALVGAVMSRLPFRPSRIPESLNKPPERCASPRSSLKHCHGNCLFSSLDWKSSWENCF